MTLTATIYQVDIDLANHDRGVYETLQLRVARHPSESADFLATRLLAYALEYEDGIQFSKGGISSPEEPAIAIRDLTGACRRWIEIGTPEPERLHRAAKAAASVAVYAHRDPMQWLERVASARVHKAHTIDLWMFERALITGLVERLDRRTTFALAVSDRQLFISIGSETLTGMVTTLPLEVQRPNR